MPRGPFHARPFLELDPALTSGLLDAVQDPAVRALPHGVGCIEQWVDGVDVLVVPQRRRAAVRAVLAAG